MMNRISRMGARILMDRTANLHASGHGYHDELAELIQLVKPQHFLPIHGAFYVFFERIYDNSAQERVFFFNRMQNWREV